MLVRPGMESVDFTNESPVHSRLRLLAFGNTPNRSLQKPKQQQQQGNQDMVFAQILILFTYASGDLDLFLPLKNSGKALRSIACTLRKTEFINVVRKMFLYYTKLLEKYRMDMHGLQFLKN